MATTPHHDRDGARIDAMILRPHAPRATASAAPPALQLQERLADGKRRIADASGPANDQNSGSAISQMETP
jgi:hypothetical protein